MTRCWCSNMSSRGSLLSLRESGRSSAKSMYSPRRICSTNFGGIGGRPGPASNPGRAERDGAINSDEGAMGDGPTERGAAEENIGAMTEGVGVVEPAAEPARKADDANGAPSEAQTVRINDGKDNGPPGSEDDDVEAAE